MPARAASTLVVGLGFFLSSGCEDRPEAGATPSVVHTRWVLLGSWSGRGDAQTGSFDVTSGALRLAWTATEDSTSPDPGHLGVSLYSAISGRPLQTLIDTVGVGSDTVRAVDEPRVAYLVVESEGVDWRIILEEAVVVVDDPGGQLPR